MQNKYVKIIVIGALTFILGIAFSFTLVFVFKDRLPITSTSSSNGICYTNCENKVTITDTGISDAVEKIYDAVVLVQNYKNEQLYATGTGFVYKVDENFGYILTNYHVISGNTSVRIVLSSDETVDAIYAGGDQYMDVAVLKIAKDKVIKVAEIGSSLNSRIGDTVFTVGTPIDYEYRGTVTRGILSGKDRVVSVSVSSNDSDYAMRVLQTDAAINSGNSGGPLVNSNGEVIGINSLKLVDDEIEGMGFAIPIEDIITAVDTFEVGGTLQRPYLGISMVNASSPYALARAGITINSNVKTGVVIASVSEGSAYGLLEKGDTIIKIDDADITDIAYLRYELFKHEVGDTIKVTFIRGSEEKTIDITLKTQLN